MSYLLPALDRALPAAGAAARAASSRSAHHATPPRAVSRIAAACARRSGRFDPQALLCTDPAHDPQQVVRWFVQRWQVEVTFGEVRDHLGVETQRQWSERAVARTTPCLLALFSLVTLLAARLDHRARSAVCTAAWYRKPRPTLATPWPPSGAGFGRSRVS